MLVYLWAGRRDWRAGAILAGVAAGYLPWFLYQERTIFSFYAVAFVPYLVPRHRPLPRAGPRAADASATRRQWARRRRAYVLLVVANFAYLLPVISAQVLPYADWYSRMWWKSRSRSDGHRGPP